MSDNHPDLETNAPADLPMAVKSMKREISQLQHELRRVRDGLERNPTRDLQRRARQLLENIALNQRELEKCLARQAAESRNPLSG